VAKAFARRPVKSRQTGWIRALAGWLTRRRVPPNVISVFSVVAAVAAAVCLIAVHTEPPPVQVILLLVAAGLILLRLLANVVDGLVAVEGGLKSATGDLFNEVPDRLSDVVIIAGAGYAIPGLAWGVSLGWLAAVLAVLTAYVRLLGATFGFAQDFSGPMAKAHRMAALSVGIVASIAEVFLGGYRGWTLAGTLVVIAVGSFITLVRRLTSISRHLANR
jgi:phosphatidylglycerophosphate synthase